MVRRRVVSALTFAVLITAACFSSQIASAGSHGDQPHLKLLKAWFFALERVEREVFSEIIADDAVIEIRDLDLTQTKDEFIASLDEWSEAADGAVIKFRVGENPAPTETSATAFVCYLFPHNTLFSEEIFEFRDDQIIASVQEAKGEDCLGFDE